jgi:hypothetical protein
MFCSELCVLHEILCHKCHENVIVLQCACDFEFIFV